MKKLIQFVIELFAGVEEQEFETEDVFGYIVRQQMFAKNGNEVQNAEK